MTIGEATEAERIVNIVAVVVRATGNRIGTRALKFVQEE